jgi:hypothetical protein
MRPNVEKGMKAVRELAYFADFDPLKAEKLARWMAGVTDLDHAYNMGMDYYLNGVRDNNCHFSLFSTKEGTKAWERGRDDATKGVSGGLYVPSHRQGDS